MRDIKKNKDVKKKVKVTKKEWDYFIRCSKRYNDLNLFLKTKGNDALSVLTTMRDHVKNSIHDFPEYGTSYTLDEFSL